MGADAVLVKVLARREVPPGGGPQDVGVAVIDAATCFAAYRWAACGQRQTARVVTVGGERADRSGNFWLPFGVSCELTDGKASTPVIHGGPMIGMECEPNCVIGPATDAVLAIDADVPATPSPCIRCGWCTDHCPARLNVAALNDNFELGRIRRSQKALAMACVECGCCSYVCPARLPLSQRVRQLKQAITSVRRRTTTAAGGEV
jgi:electron transport complex protein RnfC